MRGRRTELPIGAPGGLLHCAASAGHRVRLGRRVVRAGSFTASSCPAAGRTVFVLSAVDNVASSSDYWAYGNHRVIWCSM